MDTGNSYGDYDKGARQGPEELPEPTRFGARQLQILEGLQRIGPEVAEFYRAAVQITADASLPARPYLLAHVAREIDNALCEHFVRVREASQESSPEGEAPGHARNLNHPEKIGAALGRSRRDPVVKAWYEVHEKLHKYAHGRRKGEEATARQLPEFLPYWRKYEDILFALLSDFYDVIRELDGILAVKEPTEDDVERLKRLLARPGTAHRDYFFDNLTSPEWLEPLRETGFFLAVPDSMRGE